MQQNKREGLSLIEGIVFSHASFSLFQHTYKRVHLHFI